MATNQQIKNAYLAWLAAKTAYALRPSLEAANRVERAQERWYQLEREAKEASRGRNS